MDDNLPAKLKLATFPKSQSCFPRAIDTRNTVSNRWESWNSKRLRATIRGQVSFSRTWPVRISDLLQTTQLLSSGLTLHPRGFDPLSWVPFTMPSRLRQGHVVRVLFLLTKTLTYVLNPGWLPSLQIIYTRLPKTLFFPIILLTIPHKWPTKKCLFLGLLSLAWLTEAELDPWEGRTRSDLWRKVVLEGQIQQKMLLGEKPPGG